jgi:hypothetical protein
MRDLITTIFALLFISTFWITVAVGIAWLFDYYPNNLYNLWEVSYKSFAISLLLLIFFGGNKE